MGRSMRQATVLQFCRPHILQYGHRLCLLFPQPPLCPPRNPFDSTFGMYPKSPPLLSLVSWSVHPHLSPGYYSSLFPVLHSLFPSEHPSWVIFLSLHRTPSPPMVPILLGKSQRFILDHSQFETIWSVTSCPSVPLSVQPHWRHQPAPTSGPLHTLFPLLGAYFPRCPSTWLAPFPQAFAQPSPSRKSFS